MDYLFLLGRILYGGFFMVSGANHFRHLTTMSGYAASKGVPYPKVAVALSGLLIFLGGASVAAGFYPSVGLLGIIIFLVPVSFIMHSFWNDTDPVARMSNEVNFKKNMALLGAAVMLLAIPLPWAVSF